MRLAWILIALAGATSAHADGARTLHLAVHGPVDTAAVGGALAKELGVEVAVVDGTCELPCLDVAIDGQNAATIMFSPRTGAPRERSAMLGNDNTQWPLVITLLAGNIVRDEAQDVLAGLPADSLASPGAEADVPPPPELVVEPVIARPAPVVMAAPAPEVREHRWLGLGFVPGLSTDLTRVGSVQHALSVDVLVGVSGGSSGVTISGLADVERGPVSGLQIAGLVSAARSVAGTQLAGIASAAGDVDGVQAAGIASVAGRARGFQLAGIATFARRDADNQGAGIATVAFGDSRVQAAGIAALTARDAGLQLAGLASVAGRTTGVQAAGIAAVSGRDARFQAAGIASVARGTANVQLAGVVNVARRLTGMQIAPINVAREGKGTQIGVINVGGDPDGLSFGLINIVPGGRYDLEASFDTEQIGTLLFRHGGRRWHNVYGVAGRSIDEGKRLGGDGVIHNGPNDDVWMYGLGFGPSLTFGRTVIDLEAIGWQVNHGASHETDVSILGQLRLSVAHHWGAFALVAGGVLNTYVTTDESSPLMLERRTSGDRAEMDGGTSVTIWPSAFVGVRI